MRKLVLLAAMILGVVGIAHADPAPKVTICHFTSSDTNPWNRIVVSANAIGGHFDNPGTPKAGHEDDLLFEGEVDCPAPGDDPTPPPSPQPSPQPNPQPTPPAPNPVTITDEEFDRILHESLIHNIK